MKIAYLSTFYPFRGGIAQFNAALFREFEKNHTIKAFNFKRQYPDILFPGTSQYVTESDIADKIETTRLLDTINPISYLSTANEIAKFAPDIMIMKFWMPFFAPSLGWVSRSMKKLGTKNFAILDNVIPHERRIGDIALTKFFLNQIDTSFVMSNSVKNDLLTLKPDAKYVDILHPLYDHFSAKIDKTLAREKLNIPKDKKVLLFFGLIRDYKGLDLLIDSLKYIDDSYHLVIAGEVYGNFEKYQEQINRENLNNKISLNVKYISDNDVPLFFSASDVCVLPYKEATQSGIVGISYHYDLPMIATDVGSLREMIEPYGTGLIVEKANSELLKDKIIEFFNKDNNIFINNIKSYKEIANWKILADRIISSY
jgi:glycosyltransferase involved in cell wall biosynthesis